MSITDFLQQLCERYGDVSLTSIFNRYDFPPQQSNQPVSPPPPDYPPVSSPPPNYPPASPPPQIRPTLYTPTKSYSPVTSKNKFTPINIASAIDWIELRLEVLNLSNLNNFFVGKQDSQSGQFLRLIDNYKKSVEKNLAIPSDFNESTASSIFVEKLSEVIKKRFYVILKSCAAGLRGTAKEPTSYYREIENRVKKYFSNIGLKSVNIPPNANFRDWLEYMEKPEIIPAQYDWQDNKISEVFIQPHYFEYYNDDGEIETFSIEGECTVLKK